RGDDPPEPPEAAQHARWPMANFAEARGTSPGGRPPGGGFAAGLPCFPALRNVLDGKRQSGGAKRQSCAARREAVAARPGRLCPRYVISWPESRGIRWGSPLIPRRCPGRHTITTDNACGQEMRLARAAAPWSTRPADFGGGRPGRAPPACRWLRPDRDRDDPFGRARSDDRDEPRLRPGA